MKSNILGFSLLLLLFLLERGEVQKKWESYAGSVLGNRLHEVRQRALSHNREDLHDLSLKKSQTLKRHPPRHHLGFHSVAAVDWLSYLANFFSPVKSG